jgi:hypothetical protein
MALERLKRLLPELARLSYYATEENVAQRSVELLVRVGEAPTVEAVLAETQILDGYSPALRSLRRTQLVAWHAAARLERGDDLGALLKEYPDFSSRQALLLRAMRLGRVELIVRALAGWTFQQVLPILPLEVMGRFPPHLDEAVAGMCRAIGLRHPILYRATARRGDVDQLRRWAEQARALSPVDVNGGWARRSLVPWAFGAIVEQSAKAGHVDVARDLLTTPVDSGAEALPRLRSVVGQAAARLGRLDLASAVMPTTASEAATLEVHRCGAVNGRLEPLLEQLQRVDPDAASWLLVSLFFECLETRGPAAAEQALRAAIPVVRERATHRGAREDLDDRLGTWLRMLAERYCADRAYLRAARCADGLLENQRLGAVAAYHAAVVGERAVALELLAGLTHEEQRPLSCLLVEDWRQAKQPQDLTLEERFHWRLLEAETQYGRSEALEGFGIPEGGSRLSA